MLKKLIVVYNPRSSRHAVAEREVLAPARELKGWLVGKYEIQPVGAEENAERLARILNDGDLVIAAGGDGTAMVAANGILLSGKDVTMSALGYGNFNDFAKLLKTKRPVEYGGDYIGGVLEIVGKFETGKVREIYPLEVMVNGRHWRYAPCYVTVGMLAESTGVFDEPKVREKLKTGKKGLIFSLWQLVKWYFRNRKRDFLPSDGELVRMAKGRGKTQRATREVEEELPEVSRVQSAEGEAKEKVSSEEVSGKASSRVSEEMVQPGSAAWREFEQTLAMPKVKLLTATVEVQQRLEQPKGRKLLARSVVKVRLVEIGAKSKQQALKVGRASKARLLALRKTAGQKVLEIKQGRIERRAREVANRPEIIIDGAKEQRSEVSWREKREFRGRRDWRDERDKHDEREMDCAVEAQTMQSQEIEVGELRPGVALAKGTTDYIALNSPRMAKIMRGGKWYRRPQEFRSTVARLGGFWRLVGFMLGSMILRVPGKKTVADVLEFETPAEIAIQTEGEHEKLANVKRIEIVKSEKPLKVVF